MNAQLKADTVAYLRKVKDLTVEVDNKCTEAIKNLQNNVSLATVKNDMTSLRAKVTSIHAESSSTGEQLKNAQSKAIQVISNAAALTSYTEEERQAFQAIILYLTKNKELVEKTLSYFGIVTNDLTEIEKALQQGEASNGKYGVINKCHNVIELSKTLTQEVSKAVDAFNTEQ